MWSNSAQIEKRRKMQNLTQLDCSWTNASEAAVTFLQSIAFDVVMTKSIKTVQCCTKTVAQLYDAYHDSKWFDMRSSACHVLFHIHSARVILVAVSPT